MKPDNPAEYLNEALKLSRRALDLDPENSLACATLGLAYLKAGRPGDAVYLLEKAAENHPAAADGPAEINISLAQAYCHTGLTERAESCFQKVLGEAAPSPTASLLLAWYLLAAGKEEAAAKAFQKTTELDPGLAGAHSALACVYALLGRYEPAIEEFGKNAAKNGPNAFDMCAIGACLFATGADKKALSVLEEPSHLPPEKVTPLDQAAVELAESEGLFQHLRDFYLRAALGKDRSGLRLCRRGTDLLILRLCEWIISRIEGKKLPLHTPQLLPYYLKCSINWKLGAHDQNIESCQHILETDSRDPLATRLLRQSNEALGTPDKEVGVYKALLTRNSRDIGAALRIIAICLEQGDMNLALVYCRKALDIEPQNLQANYNMGLILLRKERAYAALPYLQKAADLDSSNAVTLLALGDAQAQTGNLAAARRAWEKVSAADTHGEWGHQARKKLASLEGQPVEPPPLPDTAAKTKIEKGKI